jgi:hypothetical protein
MININWDEYKYFKATNDSTKDNFTILIEFLKSFYNMSNIYDLYNTLSQDSLSVMMLDKRDITDAVSLEKYILKQNVI